MIPFDGDLKRKLESLLSDEKKGAKTGTTENWRLETGKSKTKKEKEKT